MLVHLADTEREHNTERARDSSISNFRQKKTRLFFLGFRVPLYLGSQKLDTKKKEEKKGLSFLSVPPPIFFRAVVSVMGRIKQHFLDQGLTAKDVPLAFACVLFVFFFLLLFSFSLVLLAVSKGKRSFLRL